MTEISIEGTPEPALVTALLEIRCRLATALVRAWEEAVRQAERPGRYVPYC